uniref:RNA_pol_Rbc25 domain-containing protein n=1 Tax=Steinernema glaseri TaxID=37863 RepID=A0A1I7ZD39_9BILA
MFVLSVIKDTIQSKPHQFDGDYEERLTTSINNRYSNKVIPNVGLAMNLFDFVEIGEAHILPGDGSTYTQVVFRLVVFRPFVGQVLEGVVLTSSKEGVFITLDFFDDIRVPPSRLPHNSRFDQNEQSWYWAYQTSPEGEETRLFMDPGKRVRFRVVKEIFNDVQPGEEDNGRKSYELEASMAESGLGCMLWWLEFDDEGEEEEGEEEA